VRIISVISIYVAENVDLLLESIQYCRRYIGEPRIYFGILLPHAASCIINPTVSWHYGIGACLNYYVPAYPSVSMLKSN
uniref:Uncharacterized protein n=1 Tax=Panthera tigris altaica TaxID=74533 RepID=A0A8C9M8C9_PANTA